ncbi:hypothetical protein PSYPI_23437 [Pseudomonas syringae pv. pisi str. 1704B]|uniref:Uncharacterized protein n=1 Tax=Pseudomonas syringae pv. pisi str. 1704B TaxID=629263 RepID=F3GDH9_PSESJ|nr:hypothetical protein PSYPI_23437 [Pseudomonas syringae pv. pisi str. 1704B]
MLGHQLGDPVDKHADLDAMCRFGGKATYIGMLSSCQSSNNGTRAPRSRYGLAM